MNESIRMNESRSSDLYEVEKRSRRARHLCSGCNCSVSDDDESISSVADFETSSSFALIDAKDSEVEQAKLEGVSIKSFHRKMSTSRQLKARTFIKEGWLFKHSKHFLRWKKCYVKLKGRTLFYARKPNAAVFHEVDLIDISVADIVCRGMSNVFQVITPFESFVFSAKNKREMHAWISSIGSAGSSEYCQFGCDQYRSVIPGNHNWFVCSHVRPTYCNVCREALSGVTWHGLSCEVCKLKAHKRCAVKVTRRCKWTTFDTVGSETIYDDIGCLLMPHQWLEGNLPVSAKCSMCDRTCGSVLRLQDWRCLWCKALVHSACKDSYPKRCPMGTCRVSVLPPIAVKNLQPDGRAQLSHGLSLSLGSPLLVLLNTKSGDNQGIKFLRRFRQLLNPVQVYDLMNGGPEFGLSFFRIFESFRVLICGGDGSVGWVLSSLDKLDLHSKCQVGVLPLGTGNDLARVLGWGNTVDDEAQLESIIERFERAQTKLLDRWSIMLYESQLRGRPSGSRSSRSITAYEDSVATHLSQILQSDDISTVITSAKVLCETVKDFVAKVGDAYKIVEADTGDEDSIANKCRILEQKLDSLLKTLHEESKVVEETQKEEPKSSTSTASTGHNVVTTTTDGESSPADAIDIEPSSSDSVPEINTSKFRKRISTFQQREALMSRANSLKKAVRQIIEHAERAVDEQNEQTEKQQNKQRKQKKRRRSLGKMLRRRSSSRSPSPSGASSGHSQLSLTPPISPFVHRGSSKPVQPSIAISHGRQMDAPRSAPPTNRHEEQSAFPFNQIVTDGSAVEVIPSDPEPSSSCVKGRSLRSSSVAPGCSNHPSTVSHSTSFHNGAPGPSGNKSALAVPTMSVEPPTPVITPASSQASVRFSGSPPEGAELIESGGVSQLNVCRSSARWLSRRRSSSVERDDMSSYLVQKRTSLSKRCVSDNSLKVVEDSDASSYGSRRISDYCVRKSSSDRSPSPQRMLSSVMRGVQGSKGSLIAEVLLLNVADVLGIAAPLMDFMDVPLDRYYEKRVMNNYFGIGLDAKIALEFNTIRDECTDRTRSRSKLIMWYGMLGTKELLQRTYKGLEQRVHLECDGHAIRLPSLQGIVVLNIPSYQGGAKFWAPSKEGDQFSPQSFDDKLLEVVAISGVIQCATSRVVSLRNHRIQQCRNVKIVITGDEPVAVQVDGEAWMQPPGFIQIVHKNRAQLLVRNRQFETTLKTWAERQRQEEKAPHCLLQMYTEDETRIILSTLDSANTFLHWVKKGCNESVVFDRSLGDSVEGATHLFHKLYPAKKLSDVPHLNANLMEFFTCMRSVQTSCTNFLDDRFHNSEFTEAVHEELETSTENFFEALKEFSRVLMLSQSTGSLDKHGRDLSPHVQSSPEKKKTRSKSKDSGRRNSRFAEWLLKARNRRKGHSKPSQNVRQWNVHDVGYWLDSIELGQYKENFVRHDIRGEELLHLERGDIKDLGIEKVGHIKRLQQAVGDLRAQMGPGTTYATEDSVSSL